MKSTVPEDQIMIEDEEYKAFSKAYRDGRFASPPTDIEIHDAFIASREEQRPRGPEHKTLTREKTKSPFDARQWLILMTVISVIAGIVFPPFQLLTGGQIIHMGFGFLPMQQLGQVNTELLFAELVAIALCYWLLDRLLLQAQAQTRVGSPKY